MDRAIEIIAKLALAISGFLCGLGLASLFGQGVEYPSGCQNGVCRVTVVEDSRAVIEETGNISDQVEQSVFDQIGYLPSDDWRKWWVIVFWDTDEQSTKLKQDFERSPYLRPFTDWGHYNTHWRRSPFQRERIQSFAVKTWPTIVVVTPVHDPAFEYQYVFRQNGNYVGPNAAKELATNMIAAIKRVLKKTAEATGKEPDKLGFKVR